MKNDKTICEAIKMVLKDKPEGMTSEQIYKSIIENNLYKFSAKNPQSVVASTIRNSCIGIDNKFSSRDKEFVIVKESDNAVYYALNEKPNYCSDDDLGHTKNNEKVTYLSEIIAVLEELGGTASLSEINNSIEKRK